MTQIMQDGPPTDVYRTLTPPVPPRPICQFYDLAPYTVDREIAYVDQDEILKMILRTYDKMAETVKAFEHGQREHFFSLRECCYCDNAPKDAVIGGMI